MVTLEVGFGERSYPIFIGSGLIDRQDVMCHGIVGSDVLLVTNETVGPLYLERARQALQGLRVGELVLPDGEAFKTLEMASRILDALVEGGFGRDATVMALGGGVVGDMAGFAAACYQRGVACVQVPTTLLSQVDSSVGGKTAVNHARGKNLIGAFHQPVAVVADTDTLDTLDERELRAGLAEVVKYGAILDGQFLDWLANNVDKLLARDTEALTHAIRRSCELKAQVVMEDEREQGRRAILNFGHTFGHAIETLTGYSKWLHGEAVAAGMVMAADFSSDVGMFNQAEAQRLRELILHIGLPVMPPRLAPEAFMKAMGHDKKVMAGRIRLVLLSGVGSALVTDEHSGEELESFVEARLHGAAA